MAMSSRQKSPSARAQPQYEHVFHSQRRPRADGRGKPQHDRLNNSPMGHIILDECSIPDYCLVGEENVGYPLIKPLLNEGRLDMAAVAVGISQAALDDSVSFAGRVGCTAAAWPPIRACRSRSRICTRKR